MDDFIRFDLRFLCFASFYFIYDGSFDFHPKNDLDSNM